MAETSTITVGTRLKAWVCRLCPFCIIARRRPQSSFAQWLASVETNCVCCRAYRKVQEAARTGGDPPEA